MPSLQHLLNIALSLPCTLITSFTPAAPEISDEDVDFHALGVQADATQTPKRFLNICSRKGEVCMIYFKHNQQTIQGYYQQYDCMQPSEVITQYWSKLFYPNTLDEAFVIGLIEESYQLIVASLPKKHQATIELSKHK